ncbi:MAG: DUF3098 domain-containing protein [Bacteroidota bacterium]
MAQVRQNVSSKKSVRTVKKTYASPFSIYWEKNNYMLLLAGVLVLIAGFFLMSRGEWNSSASLYVSPILLIAGYLIILPLSIFYKKKNAAHTEKSDVSGKS